MCKKAAVVMKSRAVAFSVLLAVAALVLGGCSGTAERTVHLRNSGPVTGIEASLSLDSELERLDNIATPIGADEAVFAALKAELAGALKAKGVARFASAPPMTPNSCAPLLWDSKADSLTWGYYCTGDYNQDSLVGVNDITPLGQNYLAEVPADPNSLLAVVDGNGDGLITVNDITQIGQSYGARVTSYNVYSSTAQSDYPANAEADNGNAALLGNVPFPEGAPPAGQRRVFSFAVSDAQAGTYFWVRPTDGGNEGTPSNYYLLTATGNAAPQAFLSAEPLSGKSPVMVEFDSSLSIDTDGEIVKFEWDWDGAVNDWSWFDSGSTNQVEHEFSATGSYSPTVRVTDNQGATDIASVQVVVGPPNMPPVAALDTEPAAGNAPLTVSLSAEDSEDPDGTIENYEWDLNGDDNYSQPGEEAAADGSPVVETVFAVAGKYFVSVRVTDDDGASVTTGRELSVTEPPNTPPTAVLTADPYWGVPPLAVSLSAAESHDPDGTIENYEWDLNGDSVYSEAGNEADAEGLAEVEVNYATDGAYTAAVRVTDDRGASEETSITVFIVPAGGNPAWPMRGHDLRHSGRSPCVGPQTRHLQWAFTTGDKVYCAPTVGEDGTIYVGSYDCSLYALNADGSIQWSCATEGSIYSSPAIGEDGTVYVGSKDNNLYAINPDGSQKWKYVTGDCVFSSPAIGPDGTVYVGSDDDNLYAVTPGGQLKWLYTTGDDVKPSPAIGTDGTVYVGSWDTRLYAIKPDGSLKWSYPTGNYITSSPAIGLDGTVYVGGMDYQLYAIKPDGSLKWKCPAEGELYSSPAIGMDGTIYIGSLDNKLHAVNPDGSPQWTYITGGRVYSSPAIDALGTIYVGGEDGKVYAINPDGSLKWSNAVLGQVISSPAIGPDGSLYVGSHDTRLYAFGPGE